MNSELSGRHERYPEREIGLLLDPMRHVFQVLLVRGEASLDKLAPTAFEVGGRKPSIGMFLSSDVVHMRRRQAHAAAQDDYMRRRQYLRVVELKPVFNRLGNSRARRGRP